MTGDRGEPLADAGGAGGAYEGLLGRTRTETVQVWMPDDSVRSLSVYVGVDAVSDPELAQKARNGTLHRVAEGVDLAVPFVYHDRTRPLLVLVVPETLRHRALAIRAEHMALLAADVGAAVPPYARDLELVVGPSGLNARLDAAAQGSPLPPRASMPVESGLAQALRERERELELRERLLEAREQALRTVPPAFRPLDADNSLYADELTYGAEEAVDDELEEVEELEDDVVLSADEDVSDYDEVSSELPVEAVTHALVLDEADGFDVSEGVPVVPVWFADDPTQDLCLTLSGGRPWLIVRGIEAWAGSEIDLLVQLARDTVAPVVLLTLVSSTEDGDTVLRSALDHEDPAQRAALRAVAEHFEVEVAAWASDGSLEHLATVMAPRERNVRAILTHLEQQAPADRALWEVARSHALSVPFTAREHPFLSGVTREPPRTATEAAVMLDDVAEWLTPERQKLLLLSLCVPDAVIDANVREVVAYAVDWGLSLPPHVAARALELGLEKDEAALLLRRFNGLCRASKAEDYGGLEESVLRAMWSEALEQAARLGVALSDEARDMAQQHAGERALVHAAALSDPHDQALEPLRARALRGETADPEAMLELVARGAYRDLLAVCRVTQQLDTDEAARVFVHVARRNDPVALDALLSLLSTAEAPRVRLGAALALASRHAVAAIDELCRLVAHAPEPEWRPFARALGRYGAGSFRAITRALTQEGASDERSAEVLAHLALHGARAQVRAKARVRAGKDAPVAQRALSRAAELREGKNPDPALEQQDPLTVFCEGFDVFLRDVPS